MEQLINQITDMKNNKIKKSLLGHLPKNYASICINSKGTQRCHPSRPCRKMTCNFCAENRRSYFIKQGVEFIEKNQIFTFLTVAFKVEEERKSYEWNDLFVNSKKIWSQFYRHPVSKYIKCLALGLKDSKPHNHLVLDKKGADRFLKISREVLHNDITDTDMREVTDPNDLLGYLFDMNFKPSFCRDDRPPRIRLLTASRGLKCGFPDDAIWKQINKYKMEI